MAKHLVEEGTQDIPVGTPIFVTVEDADSVAAFKDFTVDAAPTAPPSPAEEPAPVEAATPPAPPAAPAAPKVEPVAAPAAPAVAPAAAAAVAAAPPVTAGKVGLLALECPGGGEYHSVKKSKLQAEMHELPFCRQDDYNQTVDQNGGGVYSIIFKLLDYFFINWKQGGGGGGKGGFLCFFCLSVVADQVIDRALSGGRSFVPFREISDDGSIGRFCVA